MVREQMQLLVLEKSAVPDVNHGFRDVTTFGCELSEYERQLKEDNEVDFDYKDFLLNILAKEKRAKLNKKRREKDEEHDINCYHEEENDPHYELFLKNLKEHGKSYMLESQVDGLYAMIKYEGDPTSDTECDPEPQRKLRSAMKQKDRSYNEMPNIENQHKNDSQSTPTKETEKLTWRRRLRNIKREKVENVKLSASKIVPDSDYLAFMSTLKVVGDNYVFEYGDHTVVYELKDGENNHEKEKQNDGSFSNMAILDSTFCKEGNLNFSMVAVKDEVNDYEREHNDGNFSDLEILETTTYNEENLNFSKRNKGSNLNDWDDRMQSEFRQKVIEVLRRPFDEEEYDKLWQDIELRKPEERHMELRNGRERSYAIEKDGRSYLDHYPELERKLLQVQDDKPKCLNLLRGFFFWLTHPGQIYPWQDAECLAIRPGSG